MDTQNNCNHTLGLYQSEYAIGGPKVHFIEVGYSEHLLHEKEEGGVSIDRFRFCPECGKDIRNYTFPEECNNTARVVIVYDK